MLHDLLEYVRHQMMTNQFFSATALFGVLTSAAYSLRSYPARIANRIHRLISFSATIEQQDYLYRFLDRWVEAKYGKEFRNVEVETTPNYSFKYYPYNKEEEVPPMKFSHQNDYVYVWYGHRYIRLSKTKTKLESAHDIWNVFSRSYTISGYFAKKAIFKLLTEVYTFGLEEERRQREEKKAIKLYEHNSYGEWNSKKIISGKKFDKLFFAQKQSLIADLDGFLAKKDLYEKAQIPFKRGYLFYGSPGNGKSSIAYAIAEHLKYDVYMINPATLIPENFNTAFNNIPSNSIVLIEDIDSFYNQRKPINNNKVNYSTFINALSGVEKKENIITVFTTNHIENLDPALIRAGRCDLRLCLENPSKEIIEEFLSSASDTKVVLSRYSQNFSFAHVQNIYMENIDDIAKTISHLEKE